MAQKYSEKFLDTYRYWNVEYSDWLNDTFDWFEERLAEHGFELNNSSRNRRNQQEIYFEDRDGWDCWFAGYFKDARQALREIGASRKDFPITYKLMETEHYAYSFKTLGNDERRRSLVDLEVEDTEAFDNLPDAMCKAYYRLQKKETNKLEELLQEWYYAVRSEFANILEEEYDYLTSDECVSESLECNDIVEEDAELETI